jgi:predicted glutamine amidotransferase
MCGIVGYLSNEKNPPKEVENAVTNMLWVDSIRGYHSTGIIYQKDDEVSFYKKAMTGWDFIQLDEPNKVLTDLRKTPFLIGHNRAATQGTITHANAHPFAFDHIVGVHNGTLTYPSALNPGDYFPVDSMHAYKSISVRGAIETIPRLQGSFALFWHDSSDNTVHFIRNESRPFTFLKVKDKEILLSASEKDMLKWIVRREGLKVEYCWDPKPYHEYIFNLDEDAIIPDRVVERKRYVAPPQKKQNNKKKEDPHAKKQNGYQPPQEPVSIAFFIDCFVPNQHLSNGVRTFTAYGESESGKEVICYAVEEGELEEDIWYIGPAYWVESKVNKPYYQLTGHNIKPHPVEVNKDAVNICTNCTHDFADEEVVWVDNAPVCIACAQQLNVKDKDVHESERHKLHIH